jgi:hypothetical protein
MPWWAQSNPRWRPPPLANPRPLDRLRDQLNAIIGDDEHGKDWLKSLAERLPGEAFLEHRQMTADEIRTISGFCSEFGEDMQTGRLVRRLQEAPHVSPQSRSKL